MWSRTFTASRSMAARTIRTQTRTFSRPAALQADLIQDLYLKEIKAYKVPAPKPGEAEAHVQKFAVPKAPASPEETDLSSSLPEYENQTVEIEGSASAESGSPAVEEDWFEEEKEEASSGGH